MKESVLDADLALSAADDASSAEDLQELSDLRRFVFDPHQNIDVNALEAYLTENKDQIVEQENELFSVDIKSMMTTVSISAQVQESTQISSGAGASAASMRADKAQEGGATVAKIAEGTALGAVGQKQESAYFQEMQNEEALQGLISSQKHIYSTAMQELTESDAEYVIVAVKHFFEKVVILQYQIQNTIEDQILSNVQVKLNNLESE